MTNQNNPRNNHAVTVTFETSHRFEIDNSACSGGSLDEAWPVQGKVKRLLGG